jgi:DNA modification methylase
MNNDSGRLYYETDQGKMFLGKCEDVFINCADEGLSNKFNLIFTSPPFPLNRAKKYGNMQGEEYLNWIADLAIVFKKLLAEDGSIVIEIGNAWEAGSPVHSTLPVESLLKFKEKGGFFLCQEFIYYNPAKLPAPVEWVNKRRIRVKDAFTRVWWLSNTPYPKANNKNILEEYSKQMKKLIASGKYNAGKRPSEYKVGDTSFSVDNGGAIPSNVIIASNTVSNDNYTKYCKKNKYNIHPARMPQQLPQFFIKFLTDVNDVVLDPFAGSNTTGAIAENLGRRWISIEAEEKYIQGSMGRFSEGKIHVK